MEEIIKSLTSLDKQINDAKRNLAVQEGRFAEVEKQLKNEFGLSTIEEAEKENTNAKTENEQLEKQIRQNFEGLKNQYDW